MQDKKRKYIENHHADPTGIQNIQINIMGADIYGDKFSKNKKHPDQILPEYCRDALHDSLVLLKKISSSKTFI